jgi:hypothetical protein
LRPFVSYKENEVLWPCCCIHKTSFSLKLTNGPKRLVLHYTGLERLAMDEWSSLLDPFISHKKIKCCEYSPWAHINKTLFSSQLTNRPNKLEHFIKLGKKGLAVTKTLNLLGLFVSYDENEVLWIRPLVPSATIQQLNIRVNRKPRH